MPTQKGENLLHENITYKIRGACFAVWNKFGGSFKESIIDKALQVELENQKLAVESQKRIDIYYAGKKVGTCIPDKVINNAVLVELKCKPYLTKGDEKQFWNYLKGSDYKVGLLVNFGAEKLEIKRRVFDAARERETRVNPRIDLRSSASMSRGFSLMELVVVLALFMLIIGVVVNMFISIIDAQKRILGEEELLNQVSYVQEYASRAIRAAVKDVSADCLTDGALSYPGYIYLLTHYNHQLPGYEGIKFISKDNVCEEFFVDPADGLLKESKDGGRPQNILSSKFNLRYARFVINGDSNLGGASASDAIQPRVTMSLAVQSQTIGAPDAVFQTTVSQRNLNIPAP